ncbi:MAG TPA: hypothetical protein VGM09_31885 [Bradyrhizobium sp.]|jgi:hypothetical protein
MSTFHLARTGLLLAALCLPGSATEAAVSPFTAMAGSWSGGGVLNTSDGGQQQLRCRASYDVAPTGDELRLNLRCASDSYNFDLTSEVEYRGGEISGSWTEASRDASGTLHGRAAGDRVEASARGANFSADLSLTTRGRRQSVSIRPQGTNVTAVSLTLERR